MRLRFWGKYAAYWTESLGRFTWYRAVVRWEHMLKIGPQLDWTSINSELFDENGVRKFCPTRKCEKTYMLCGVCVHDHFIGNIMFGYWARLHGFRDITSSFAGHIAQLIGDTEDHGFDKPWDKAGYELGRILAESGKIFNRYNVCTAMLGNNGNAYSFFLAANNKAGADYRHCKPCPAEIEKGGTPWMKEKGHPKPYPAF